MFWSYIEKGKTLKFHLFICSQTQNIFRADSIWSHSAYAYIKKMMEEVLEAWFVLERVGDMSCTPGGFSRLCIASVSCRK